jgi:hypothetical protein
LKPLALAMVTALALSLPAGAASAQPPGEATAAPMTAEPVPTPLMPPPAEVTPVPPAPAPPDPAREPDPYALQLHGFVSQGFINTTDNNYLAQSERGSLEFAEAGINVTKAVSDKLRLGVQLFTRDLGPIGNYDAKFDWFYLDYHAFDWLGLRAGRVKLPFGLYNEISDIDAARVPILLPQSVYSTRNRDFLLAQTGFELYGYIPLDATGAFDYRLYAGTIFLELPPRSSVSLLELNIPYVTGGRLMYETPLPGLRVGGSAQWLRLDFTVGPITAGPPTMPMMLPGGTGRLSAVLWVTSAEYISENLLLAAEYGRWHTETESTTPAVPTSQRVQERFYVMAAYRVLPWFTPGAYVSALYPNVDDRDGRDAYQQTYAATLRFDLHPQWLFKLEGHFMHGTAELEPALNDNVSRANLEENWLVFLAKTTLFF